MVRLNDLIAGLVAGLGGAAGAIAGTEERKGQNAAALSRMETARRLGEASPTGQARLSGIRAATDLTRSKLANVGLDEQLTRANIAKARASADYAKALAASVGGAATKDERLLDEFSERAGAEAALDAALVEQQRVGSLPGPIGGRPDIAARAGTVTAAEVGPRVTASTRQAAIADLLNLVPEPGSLTDLQEINLKHINSQLSMLLNKPELSTGNKFSTVEEVRKSPLYKALEQEQKELVSGITGNVSIGDFSAKVDRMFRSFSPKGERGAEENRITIMTEENINRLLGE